MKSLPIPALRSQDAVFTLFGDYLLGRDRPVWVGSLIDLLGRLDLSPMAVRLVLSRMCRKGWLVAQRRGTRSWYGLSPRGRRLLAAGRERIYHPRRAQPWDGTWQLVSFSIPEPQRRLRHQLRVKLAFLGCGAMGNGIWLAPADVSAEVEEVATALRLTRHVELFRATHLGFSNPQRLVAQCWDLATVGRRYTGFIRRWEAERGRALPRGEAGRGEAFGRRLRLVHEYRAFLLEDPFLPAELLPADWPGHAAADLFGAMHQELQVPAERYVREVAAAGDSPEAPDARDAPGARGLLAATH